jgi:hypothetical protein
MHQTLVRRTTSQESTNLTFVVSLRANTYTWKVTLDGSDGGPKFDLAFNNQFNFILFDSLNVSAPALAITSNFNISSSTVDQVGNIISVSSSTVSPTASQSSPSSSRTSTASLPTTTESPQATSTTPVLESKPSKITTGVKVGLGVGLGGAGAAILAGLALYFRSRRTRKETRKRTIHEDTMPPKYETVTTAELAGPPMSKVRPTELDAPAVKQPDEPPIELP